MDLEKSFQWFLRLKKSLLPSFKTSFDSIFHCNTLVIRVLKTKRKKINIDTLIIQKETEKLFLRNQEIAGRLEQSTSQMSYTKSPSNHKAIAPSVERVCQKFVWWNGKRDSNIIEDKGKVKKILIRKYYLLIHIFHFFECCEHFSFNFIA